MARRVNRPPTEIHVKLAMSWWISLSIASRAHLRRSSNLRTESAICKYWLNAVSSPEEAVKALERKTGE